MDKTKTEFTAEDLHMLIVLCQRLFKRNQEIALELGKALENIDSLDRRLEFYRNTTMRTVK